MKKHLKTFVSAVKDAQFVLSVRKVMGGKCFLSPFSIKTHKKDIMEKYKNIFVVPYENGYLLYNPFTDAVAFTETLRLDKKTEDKLTEEGVLLDKGIDGPSISRFIIEKIREGNSHTLQITDAFSYQCNLKCVYCMQQNIHEAPQRMSPEQRIDEWISLMQLHNVDDLDVCLFGGEPLFNIRYLTDVLETARKKIGQVSYSIVTNGTLIDDRVIQLINEYRISRIQITLDGPEIVHNSRRVNHSINCYRTIISNIHKLLEKTASRIIINSVIDTANFDQIDQMTDMLSEEFNDYIFCDHPRIIFNYGMECHPFGKSEYTEEHIPELKKYYIDFLNLLEKEIRKGISVTEIMPTPTCIAKEENDILIAPTGDIYKCISALGVPEFRICTFEDLKKNQMMYFEHIASFSDRSFASCMNCDFVLLCNGGCYYDASVENVRQSCRKEIMEAQMPQLIKLRYITKEIESGVFRIYDYNTSGR